MNVEVAPLIFYGSHVPDGYTIVFIIVYIWGRTAFNETVEFIKPLKKRCLKHAFLCCF